MEQTFGKIVQGQADVVKAIGQAGKYVSQLATAGGFVGSDKLVIGAADLFVEANIGCAAQTPALSVLVKNSGDEERIISNVSSKQECLFRRRASESNQHVGDVLVGAGADPVRCLQFVRVGKCFQKRTHVVGQFAVPNSALLEDVPREHVKIKLG